MRKDARWGWYALTGAAIWLSVNPGRSGAD